MHKKPKEEYEQILGKIDSKKIAEKMEELIEDQQDASRLTSSLIHIHAFEQSFMMPCHRVLSPLLSLVQKLEKENIAEKAKNNPL